MKSLSDAEKFQVARYENLRSYANRMVWTVELQVKRLREYAEDPARAGDFVLQVVSDAEVLVVSLQRLRLASCAVSEMVNGLLSGSIRQYDAALPNLQAARNVIVHLDDYIVGKGRNKGVARPSLFVHGIGTSELDFSGYRFDLNVVLSAAERLFSSIQANQPTSYLKAVKLQERT